MRRVQKRQFIGLLLLFAGMLLIFLCLPMEIYVILIGSAMAAWGLLLLR